MINVRNAFLSAAILIGASCPVVADPPPPALAPSVRYDDARGAWVDREGNPLPTVQAKSDTPAPSDIIREPIPALPVDIQQRNADLDLAKQASIAAMQLTILMDIKRILCGMSPSCQVEGQK